MSTKQVSRNTVRNLGSISTNLVISCSTAWKVPASSAALGDIGSGPGDTESAPLAWSPAACCLRASSALADVAVRLYREEVVGERERERVVLGGSQGREQKRVKNPQSDMGLGRDRVSQRTREDVYAIQAEGVQGSVGLLSSERCMVVLNLWQSHNLAMCKPKLTQRSHYLTWRIMLPKRMRGTQTISYPFTHNIWVTND